MNKSTAKSSCWPAVLVVRGFVDEVRLFAAKSSARRVADRWRAAANPDYDEVAIVPAPLPGDPRRVARARAR